MNLFDILTRFPDQRSCIAHLERIRWNRALLPALRDVARKKDQPLEFTSVKPASTCCPRPFFKERTCRFKNAISLTRRVQLPLA